MCEMFEFGHDERISACIDRELKGANLSNNHL